MKTTTDLWLASFLIREGNVLTDYKILGHRKVSFIFDISDNDWKSLKLKYLNSEISEFEKIMEKLKDIAYGG